MAPSIISKGVNPGLKVKFTEGCSLVLCTGTGIHESLLVHDMSSFCAFKHLSQFVVTIADLQL